MKRIAGVAAVVGGSAGVYYGMNPTGFIQHLQDVANSQMAQAGFFFTAAAFLHAGRVKAEIRNAFTSLTDSINNLGNTLSQQLKEHTEKLDAHEKKLVFLGTQVSELQNKTITGEIK